MTNDPWQMGWPDMTYWPPPQVTSIQPWVTPGNLTPWQQPIIPYVPPPPPLATHTHTHTINTPSATSLALVTGDMEFDHGTYASGCLVVARAVYELIREFDERQRVVVVVECQGYMYCVRIQVKCKERLRGETIHQFDVTMTPQPDHGAVKDLQPDLLVVLGKVASL